MGFTNQRGDLFFLGPTRDKFKESGPKFLGLKKSRRMGLWSEMADGKIDKTNILILCRREELTRKLSDRVVI